MDKVAKAYEDVSKYHSALHPGKSHNKMEESWIRTVHNMTDQIVANRERYEAT
jgi:hypothetical protein